MKEKRYIPIWQSRWEKEQLSEEEKKLRWGFNIFFIERETELFFSPTPKRLWNCIFYPSSSSFSHQSFWSLFLEEEEEESFFVWRTEFPSFFLYTTTQVLCSTERCLLGGGRNWDIICTYTHIFVTLTFATLTLFTHNCRQDFLGWNIFLETVCTGFCSSLQTETNRKILSAFPKF